MFLKSLLKNPLFWMGFLFLFSVTLGSFIYSSYFQGPNADLPRVLYDENGFPVDNAPFEPSWQFPLGSDKLGHSVLLNLLEGAKYTIGLAVVIGLASLLIALVFGTFMRYLPEKFRSTLEGLADSFHYAPLAIFAYFLMAPVVQVFSWSYDSETKVVFPLIVLTCFSIPILAILVSNEMKEVMQQEFIVNAKLLGGGQLHVFRKHVMPHLVPKILVIFTQQVVRILTVLAHLGLLNVFIGGKNVVVMDVVTDFNHKTNEPITEAFSLSHEWAGLIAKNWAHFSNTPWLVLGPVIAFAMTIIAVNFVSEALKESLDGKKKSSKKVNKDRDIKVEKGYKKSDVVGEEAFRSGGCSL